MKVLLSDDLGEITVETSEPNFSKATIILAHGAGAGMHHPFMVDLANVLCAAGFRAVRFNFPYMEGGRKSPGSPKKNIETWRLLASHIAQQHPQQPVFLAGKSYGGRMASHLMVIDKLENIKGLIYFGFPLHAPGKDSKDRAAHLDEVTAPQLFLHGSKDKLANTVLMSEVVDQLSNGELITLEDADHSFNVPKRSGLSRAEVIELLVSHSSDFIIKYL